MHLEFTIRMFLYSIRNKLYVQVDLNLLIIE